MSKLYVKFSDAEIDKIGNTLIYLSSKISKLSKTKILKLLYILDELSIKKTGIPFLNLNYQVWQYGPVNEELFIELSEPNNSFLKKFGNINIDVKGNLFFEGKKQFCDDEFTENDLELLDIVVKNFGKKSAKELINYTHREKSPWHTFALQNNVLELLENKEIKSTEIEIDMSILVNHDPFKKMIYDDYVSMN